MSDFVFILGAGASSHTGAPVMGNFLDKARRLYAAGENNPYQRDFARVFGAISKLQAVHSKSELDLVNLESVFGAFEMQRLLGTEEDAEATVRSMRRVIAHTIDSTVAYRYTPALTVLPTDPYHNLAALITELRNRGLSVAVITFNYDLAFDHALAHNELGPDYRLGGDQAGVPLIKLHGSLNWARCSRCKQILVSPFRGGVSTRDEFNVAKDPANLRHCESPPEADPILVPPTWDKGGHYSRLAPVWKSAAEELATASSVIVCGYSLPETDSFFRYLYALGSVGEELFERFWVCDTNPDVHQRFRSLLGPGARARFSAFTSRFEVFMAEIYQRLLV
jgi:hypothetical protein